MSRCLPSKPRGLLLIVTRDDSSTPQNEDSTAVLHLGSRTSCKRKSCSLIEGPSKPDVSGARGGRWPFEASMQLCRLQSGFDKVMTHLFWNGVCVEPWTDPFFVPLACKGISYIQIRNTRRRTYTSLSVRVYINTHVMYKYIHTKQHMLRLMYTCAYIYICAHMHLDT